jgi:hypothetical protein
VNEDHGDTLVGVVTSDIADETDEGREGIGVRDRGDDGGNEDEGVGVSDIVLIRSTEKADSVGLRNEVSKDISRSSIAQG